MCLPLEFIADVINIERHRVAISQNLPLGLEQKENCICILFPAQGDKMVLTQLMVQDSGSTDFSQAPIVRQALRLHFLCIICLHSEWPDRLGLQPSLFLAHTTFCRLILTVNQVVMDFTQVESCAVIVLSNPMQDFPQKQMELAI